MINVVCALIRDGEGRVLACQRPAEKAQGGKWEFPGGKIEPGEAPEAALIREIGEELGCRIKVGSACPVVEYHYPGFSVRLMPFLCEVVAGEPSPVEHTRLLWAEDAAKRLDWAGADVPVWQSFFS